MNRLFPARGKQCVSVTVTVLSDRLIYNYKMQQSQQSQTKQLYHIQVDTIHFKFGSDTITSFKLQNKQCQFCTICFDNIVMKYQDNFVMMIVQCCNQSQTIIFKLMIDNLNLQQ